MVFLSWLLSRDEDFLRRVSVNVLQQLYAAEQNKKKKLRLLVAIHRKKGKSIDNISDLLNLPRRTVHGWLWRFENKGLKGIADKKQTGRPKRLLEKHLKALRKDLIQPPEKFGYAYGMWDTKIVQEHVKKKFGKHFGGRHMRRLLHRMGFSQQKPRPSDYRANKASQTRFKKNSKGWYLSA